MRVSSQILRKLVLLMSVDVFLRPAALRSLYYELTSSQVIIIQKISADLLCFRTEADVVCRNLSSIIMLIKGILHPDRFIESMSFQNIVEFLVIQ